MSRINRTLLLFHASRLGDAPRYSWTSDGVLRLCSAWPAKEVSRCQCRAPSPYQQCSRVHDTLALDGIGQHYAFTLLYNTVHDSAANQFWMAGLCLARSVRAELLKKGAKSQAQFFDHALSIYCIIFLSTYTIILYTCRCNLTDKFDIVFLMGNLIIPYPWT